MRLTPLLLLLAALTGCGGGEPASPVSRPPAGPAATTTTTPATDPADGALRLAVLGDSYSNGEAVGAQRAWPVVMAGLLTREGVPTRVVANPSVTGATTAQMLDTGLGPIRAARPDVMTVMLGVNDQVRGRTTTQFAADADRALTAAVALTGAPQRVIAVDIPDYSVSPAGAGFGDPSATSRQLQGFNRVLRRLAARRGVTLVSIFALSRRLGAEGISADGLHPSAAQLARWAAQVAAVARSRWASLARPSPAGTP